MRRASTSLSDSESKSPRVTLGVKPRPNAWRAPPSAATTNRSDTARNRSSAARTARPSFKSPLAKIRRKREVSVAENKTTTPVRSSRSGEVGYWRCQLLAFYRSLRRHYPDQVKGRHCRLYWTAQVPSQPG